MHIRASWLKPAIGDSGRVGQLAVAVSLVLSLSGTAWAKTPSETLQGVFAEATRLLGDPETEVRPLDRLIAVEKLAAGAFDFRGAAELAFGRRWPHITAAERGEFTQLFANFLGRSFLHRMATRASLEDGVNMQFLGESVDGTEAIVRTSMARDHGNGKTRIDYRMTERDGPWKVRDVIVDGIGMAANYHAQIHRVLETSSVAALLARMRAKVGVPMPVAATEPSASVPTLSTDAASTAPGAQMPPPPVTAPVSRMLTTKAYWLQVGGFSTPEEAGRLAASILGSHVVSTPEGEGTPAQVVSRIHIGPFADAAQAVFELLELQAKGYDPYLVAERH
jgi:ABC-type transporter MlaC component